MRFYPRKIAVTNGLVREIQNIPVANGQQIRTDIYCIHNIPIATTFEFDGVSNPWTIDGGAVTVSFTTFNLNGYRWKVTYSTGEINYIKQLNPTVFHLHNAAGAKTSEGIYDHSVNGFTWATVAAPHGTNWVSVAGAGHPAASPTVLRVVALFGAVDPVEALMSETIIPPLSGLAIDDAYDTGFTHITTLSAPLAADFSIRVEPSNGVAAGSSYDFYCHMIQSLKG